MSLSLEGVSLLVLSPGVLPNHILAQKAKGLGIEVMGEMELGLSALRHHRMIAITGSNGKTTTTLLIEHVLNSSGLKAKAVGNVGYSICNYAINSNPDDILVIELSSFQLQTLTIRDYMEVAAILNITPNHLDRHSSMEEYASCKLKLQNCLKEKGVFFASKQVVNDFPLSKKVEIFQTPKEKCSDLRLGKPESCNIQYAKEISFHFGVQEDAFEKAISTFRKPPFRIEWVALIDEVAYYNDSKASNVEAVIHAVSLFQSPVILIAGGMDKGSSYRPWIDAFGKKVKAIVVYGQASEKMEKELKEAFFIYKVTFLHEAVKIAKSLAKPLDTILFSPGCSSYDQFANYEERGKTFQKLVGV